MRLWSILKKYFTYDRIPCAKEEIRIVKGLIAMKDAGKIRDVYVDADRIKIEASLPAAPLAGIKHEITWKRAAEMVAEFEAEL